MAKDIVYLAKIDAIQPHSNADKLELAIIGGWQCIVAKNQFKVGDEVVYICVDSIIPDDFARHIGVYDYLSKGRVRAIKLRGEKSYGLVVSKDSVSSFGCNVSGNLADALGIKKYEVNEPEENVRVSKKWPFWKAFRYIFSAWNGIGYRASVVFGKKWRFFKGYPKMPNQLPEHPLFPKFTDIENYRNHKGILDSYEGDVAVTEKIHGTNFRAGWVDGTWMVGSHNRNRIEHKDDAYWKYSKILDLKSIIKEVHKNEFPWAKAVVIYGEVYGKGIQKLEYSKVSPDIAFFDIMVEGKYISYSVFKYLCSKYKLPTVPHLYHGKWDPSLKILGEGRSTLANHTMEGCVIRSYREATHPRVGRFVFKYVNDDYLLGNFDGYNH